MKEEVAMKGLETGKFQRFSSRPRRKGSFGVGAVGIALALALFPATAFAEEVVDESSSSSELFSSRSYEDGVERAGYFDDADTTSIDGVTYTYRKLKGGEESAKYGAGVYIVDADIPSTTKVVIPRQIDGVDVVSFSVRGHFNYVWGGDSPLYDFDASKATALKYLDISNLARSVDVSKNTALEFLDVSISIGASEWFKGHGPLTSIDVSACTSLKGLRLDQQNLSSIDVSRNTKLTYLDVAGNNLKSIDLSKNVALEILFVSHNQLSTLDVSKIVALENLFCENNRLTSLDIGKNANLVHIECNDNNLTALDTSNNAKLNFVYCARNYIADASKLIQRFGEPDKYGRQYILPQYLKGEVPRLAGDTALDTMAAITQQGWEEGSCDSVIVATMDGYWDALTATSLAGVKDCPILLTDKNELSWQTAYEVRRLGAKTVYISGGTAAISKKVQDELQKVSGVQSVKRLAGDIAINTALEVYGEGKGSWGKTAVVATSATFQDALSVSPFAFAMKAPIFLTNASTLELDPQVLSAIKAGGFDRVVIVGGPAAISTKVEKQLSGLPVDRLFGATAYETSGAIAEWCIGQGMTFERLGVATGSDYYDALAGAAFCGKNNSALILVSDIYHVNIEAIVAKKSSSIERVHVFGGPAAVSDSTYSAIVAALK
ncbi:cell wall-binding repeat-containing protein [Eggerthella lenta]|nr:cell wall-binding repeat-containing protein [Eggerthella lenta]